MSCGCSGRENQSTRLRSLCLKPECCGLVAGKAVAFPTLYCVLFPLLLHLIDGDRFKFSVNSCGTVSSVTLNSGLQVELLGLLFRLVFSVTNEGFLVSGVAENSNKCISSKKRVTSKISQSKASSLAAFFPLFLWTRCVFTFIQTYSRKGRPIFHRGRVSLLNVDFLMQNVVMIIKYVI